MSKSSKVLKGSTTFSNTKRQKQKMRCRSRKAQIPIYGYTFLALTGPSLGTFMLAITLSWNQLPFEMYDEMRIILTCGTILFQFIFVSYLIVTRSLTKLWTYLDILIFIIGCLADWYWFVKTSWGNFNGAETVSYSALTAYMTMRLWYASMKAVYSPISSSNNRTTGPVLLDKVRFVWVTQSASDVAELYPDLSTLWDTLYQKWGDASQNLCEISIFITQAHDCTAQKELHELFHDTRLYQMGVLQWERPSFIHIFQEHSLERIAREYEKKASSTLVAVCGSPSFVKDLTHAKLLNDIFLFATENTRHRMELITSSSTHPRRPRYQTAKRASISKELTPSVPSTLSSSQSFQGTAGSSKVSILGNATVEIDIEEKVGEDISQSQWKHSGVSNSRVWCFS